MNITKELSDSLLAACKAVGIEEPRYILQGASLSVYHSEHDPRLDGEKGRLYNYSQALCIDHPPYASDWQDSLLEFKEYALIRKCNKCLSVTAIDLIGNDENEKELQYDGETVFRVSKEEAHGAIVNLCKCGCGVKNFNITKSAAMAKWRESFGFTEAEKQQIEDYAVAENEPLADVLARHPDYFHFAMEPECNDDGEPIAIYARNHHGDITQMIRPDHIADTSKKVSGIEALVCADIAKRQQVGLGKYPTTVADNPATLPEWLQHAYEECLDMAVYLKRAMAELQTTNGKTERENEDY